jgi:hypothetical protein
MFWTGTNRYHPPKMIFFALRRYADIYSVNTLFGFTTPFEYTIFFPFRFSFIFPLSFFLSCFSSFSISFLYIFSQVILASIRRGGRVYIFQYICTLIKFKLLYLHTFDICIQEYVYIYRPQFGPETIIPPSETMYFPPLVLSRYELLTRRSPLPSSCTQFTFSLPISFYLSSFVFFLSHLPVSYFSYFIPQISSTNIPSPCRGGGGLFSDISLHYVHCKKSCWNPSIFPLYRYNGEQITVREHGRWELSQSYQA